MNIPKKVTDRFAKSVPKFKRILKKALDRDVNESDTVSIITDILSDVFGYDKYDEVTSEFAIKGTFCDLAIILNNKLRFLIEAKAIGINLSDNHLNQALTYGAKEGIDWIILSNGVKWEIYYIVMKPKLEAVKLCDFNFLELNLRQQDSVEYLFIISKEGQSKNAIDEFHEKVNFVNKYIISAILEDPQIINSVRLKLKKLAGNLKVSNEEVLEIVSNEVFKREIIENEAFNKARLKLKRQRKKSK
jgi:hypothetical protein